eukprot:scaffold232420_cov37-Prasinocladus_malaysianus.AAC.2
MKKRLYINGISLPEVVNDNGEPGYLKMTATVLKLADYVHLGLVGDYCGPQPNDALPNAWLSLTPMTKVFSKIVARRNCPGRTKAERRTSLVCAVLISGRREDDFADRYALRLPGGPPGLRPGGAVRR